MCKKFVLLAALFISFHSLAMDADEGPAQTEEVNPKITVSVTSTSLGAPFGSINVIEFDVNSSMKVKDLYTTIQTKFFYFQKISVSAFHFETISEDDERTLSARGFKNHLSLKANRVY